VGNDNSRHKQREDTQTQRQGQGRGHVTPLALMNHLAIPVTSSLHSPRAEEADGGAPSADRAETLGGDPPGGLSAHPRTRGDPAPAEPRQARHRTGTARPLQHSHTLTLSSLCVNVIGDWSVADEPFPCFPRAGSRCGWTCSPWTCRPLGQPSTYHHGNQRGRPRLVL